MKKLINKKTILIAAIALLLLAVVGTTLAIVFTETKPVENTFNPSKVACAVVEGKNSAVTGDIVETGTAKEEVKIQNTGDTDAYIRVAVVINWMNAEGTKVWAQKPVEGTDYTITFSLSEDGWFDGGDGFYYYSSPVAPGASTDVLITSASLIKEGVTPPTGTDGTKYYLSIEIVASAIQSTPSSVVAEQWSVTVDNNGKISKSGAAETTAS